MTNNRPGVPAEIARRVLVESGHRCAIHTCRQPTTDLHHIIPWAQAREHAYENLIALCPNCHRRADRGEIDRKALRMYKARLASGQAKDFAEAEGAPPTAEPTEPWRAVVLNEAREDRPRYEAELEFPEFIDVAPDISEINDLERAAAVTRLQEFRAGQFWDFDETETEFSSLGSSLNASYEVLCCSDLVISIRHKIFHYGSGAAHPNHWIAVSNYQRDPVREVSLGDLFTRDSNYLNVLSTHCVASLVERKQLSEPTFEILSGAGPEAKNFRKFNIMPEGLIMNYEEYQVGAYVEGEFTVLVPTMVLRHVLRPKTPVTRFLFRRIE